MVNFFDTVKKWCLVSCWLIVLSCLGLLTFAKRLHPDEARTLQQMAVTMGADGWKLDDPCQSYSAGPNITCDYCVGADCHITELRLKDLHLTGTLPPELVQLTYLVKVDFTRNFLHGPLPTIWSTMKHLEFISLTANRLSGMIPKEWGSFPSLTYLSFEANNFSGSVPKEIGYLVNLTHLIFSSNKFVGRLPDTLVNLKNLQDLRLSDNNFEGPIPEFIGKFTQLRRLELYATGLKGPIPAAIFHDLENLLDLRITDIAGEKSDIPTLRSNKSGINLVLRNMNLSGTIPDSVWDMIPQMDMLDLSFNNLEGEVYYKPNTAKHVFLAGNKLNGTVPESFRLNSKGHNIDLSYNNFTWPAATCKGHSLEKLNTYQSSSFKNQLLPCLDNFNCQRYRRTSLHINCGGPNVLVTNANGSLLYEGDQQYDGYGSAMSTTVGPYWGFSSTGDFMNDDDKIKSYIIRDDERFGDTERLYITARKSPLSLTYFGCLENGTYTVKLHFSEIEFREYSGLGRRIFDIYIQGKKMSKDFNIEEEANRTGNKVVVQQYFNASVTDNTLDIRFYWAGKGTTCVPNRGYYGILISAISVCQSKLFKFTKHFNYC
ncbi:LRR-domain containing protein [Trema orientale]|uniref:non-specific serine/threonine protein kinase n=1 Tax=Trema orientale TaxID=63057 RepID=A0A2P5FDB0_TREOI|nr:LRR-domain containing protein [Trema orientale]